MELRYGQILQLKKNIDISFYCDGILPAGQMGYQETHYKIKFHQATIILPQSLICELFEEYKIENTDTITENEDKESSLDLTKLKKDELIELVKTAFPDRDYSGLKKAELIDILEGQTHE
jgi:hypothetical protein